MAKRQKKPTEDHSNDWLNTYSDMVTLLLTFFVLLYASSTIDPVKWQYIYQAFQSRGQYINEFVDSPDEENEEGSYVSNENPTQQGADGEKPQSFDQLYVYLSDYVQQNNLEGVMSVDKGSNHITIRFDNSVFFDGNSAILKRAGMEILDGISPGIKAVNHAIQRLTVSGYVAQGTSLVDDWDLSSARACSVLKYLEHLQTVSKEQFMAQGCGPNNPIADNATEEGRAKNRRVELQILKNDIDFQNPEIMRDILMHGFGLGSEMYDPDNANTDDKTKLPSNAAQSVIDTIKDKFVNNNFSYDSTGSYAGPVMPSDVESFYVSESSETGSASQSGSSE